MIIEFPDPPRSTTAIPRNRRQWHYAVPPRTSWQVSAASDRKPWLDLEIPWTGVLEAKDYRIFWRTPPFEPLPLERFLLEIAGTLWGFIGALDREHRVLDCDDDMEMEFRPSYRPGLIELDMRLKTWPAVAGVTTPRLDRPSTL